MRASLICPVPGGQPRSCTVLMVGDTAESPIFAAANAARPPGFNPHQRELPADLRADWTVTSLNESGATLCKIPIASPLMGKIAAIFSFSTRAAHCRVLLRRLNYDVVSLFARGGQAPHFCHYFSPTPVKRPLPERCCYSDRLFQTAGTVKGRAPVSMRKSDWMEMEKQRGISITTSVMQFPYHDRWSIC